MIHNTQGSVSTGLSTESSAQCFVCLSVVYTQTKIGSVFVKIWKHRNKQEWSELGSIAQGSWNEARPNAYNNSGNNHSYLTLYRSSMCYCCFSFRDGTTKVHEAVLISQGPLHSKQLRESLIPSILIAEAEFLTIFIKKLYTVLH